MRRRLVLSTHMLLFIWISSICTGQTPDEINGLNLWLRADSVSGTSVSQWYDLSTNGSSILQSNSSFQPVKINNVLNGHPVVDFDGVNDFVKGNFSATYNQPCTFFVMWNCENTGARVVLDNLSNVVLDNFNSGGVRMFLGSSVNYTKFSPFNFILTTIELNNANSKIFENGILMASGNVGTGNIPGVCIGKRFSQNDRWLDGKVAEIIFYNQILDSSERILIEEYLHNRYSASINLGSDTTLSNFCSYNLQLTNEFDNILWNNGLTSNSVFINETGLYYVSGTNGLGEIKSDTIQITYPTIPPPLNTAICSGSSNTWNADMGPGFTYLWSNGATTPSIDISTPGTYNVTVFDSFGCSKNSGNYVFTIDNYPNTASLGIDTSMCLGNTIELQVGAPETVNYSWNGDSSPSQPGSFVPNSTGEYTLESTNNNGCVARDTIIVTISGVAPVANFLVDNFCYQDALQCTDVSTAAGSDPLATWSWDFGDGNQSSDQNPTHVYDSPGYYLVELYVESAGGCGENLFVPVQIRTLPFADLTYLGYCDNSGTQFNDNSVEGEGTINNWFWNFGQPGGTGSNTSILQSPSKDYGTPGDYMVYFQVTDAYGCQDDTTFVLSILEAPQTIFTADDACENANVPLTNASSIASPYVIQSQLWDFGDGTFSILPVPSKSYTNFGYHTITLTTTADNGCTDIEQVQILVHSTPVPMFSVGPACVGTYTELNDISAVTTGWIGGSNWEIDLTENIQGITAYYQFQTEGSHNVELTTTSNFGCSATGMFIFDVGPELSADWDSYPLTIVTGVPVQFDYTGAGSEYWDWNMGNGEHVYFTDHSYTYGELWADSTIDVSLYVSNSEGCEDTLIRTFTVERAYFDLEVQKILLNEVDGFMNVGVQLHNNGTSLIDSVEVELVFSSGLMLKETYASVLQSDQTEIMVFTSLPSSFVSIQNGEPDWICAEGLPYTALNLTETDLDNNKVCLNRENDEPVIIGPYPNPASESFDLELFITSESMIDLKLIDSRGRLVLLFADGYTYSKGLYEFHVPLLSIQSGVYFLEMVNGDTRTLKKLMVE